MNFIPTGVLIIAWVIYSVFPNDAFGGCDYYVYSQLDFVGHKVKGCLAEKDLLPLFKKTLYNINPTDNNAYYFLSKSGDGPRIRTENCDEYISAIDNGLSAVSTSDIMSEANFNFTCGILNALKDSIRPKEDYIGTDDLLNLKKLPVFILPAGLEEQVEVLRNDSGKGLSFKDYLCDDTIELYGKDRQSLGVLYRATGMSISINVVAKSDFDRDGNADLFVHYFARAEEGTWRSHGNMLMSIANSDQILYNVRARKGECHYNEETYNCSKDRWDPLRQQN